MKAKKEEDVKEDGNEKKDESHKVTNKEEGKKKQSV